MMSIEGTDNGQSGEYLRLLVVGDPEGLCEASMSVSGKDFLLETAGDAERALDSAREAATAFDLILFEDVLPPRAGAEPEPLGLKLAHDLKELCPDAVLIGLTDGPPERRAELLRAGSFHCLPKPFKADELSLLLERAAEHRRLDDEVRDKQALTRVMQVTNSIFNCNNYEDIVDCATGGLHTIGFDRVRFYTPLEGEHALALKAHRGMTDALLGGVWEHGAEFAARHLGEGTTPRHFDSGPHDGGEREPLGCDGAAEWVLVPLKARGETLAVVAADKTTTGRPITEKDLAAVGMFASQAAAALQVARLLEETTHQVEQLESLRHTTLAITERRDRGQLLQTIIEQAVQLLRAKNGGIYKFSPTAGELTIINDYCRPEHIGVTLRVSEGMAGRLVAEALKGGGGRFKSVRNYAAWEDRAPVFDDKHPYGAVLEVLLRWNSEIVGVLYIDDDPGREFTTADERLLGLFADQASIALGNAELIARDEEKMRGLEKLSLATSKIMGNLAEKPLGERLTEITRYVTEILNAEVCTLALVKREGWLSLEASYGHLDDSFHPGTEIKIQSGPKLGLLGHIASEEEVFNMHGEQLREHFAVRGETPPPHLPSGRCHSLLVVPLREKSGDSGRLIGLLCAANKRPADALASADIQFTDVDVSMLRVFGEAVVVALEGASIVAELKEQKDRFELLVSSLPTGMIAVDREGKVTLFNERAEEILGYTRDYARGKPVEMFYTDREEPRRIGRMLHERGGRVIDYETKVRDKGGEVIPVKHSSTWLYDSDNKRIGSVGYFEDMRRVELLLKSSSIVVQARNLREGLQRLAELTANCLPHTFCRILLIDEDRQSLTATAAHGLSASSSPDAPSVADVITFSDWPGMWQWLDRGNTKVLQRENPANQVVLDKLSQQLRLERPIQSLLLLPLRIGGQPSGLIEFGSFKPRRPFTSMERDLATALAEKATVLIDRMHLQEQMEHRGQQLEALYQASLRIRADDKDTDRLLHEIVRIAVTMVGCEAGGLYVFDPLTNNFELRALHGLPAKLKDSRLPPAGQLVIEVARTGRTLLAPPQHAAAQSDLRPPDSLGFSPRAAVPLKNEAGTVEAVLFVGGEKSRRSLGRSDVEALNRFAAQASVALQISHLLTEEQRTFGKLTTLNRISDYLQATRDIDKMLHALLTGVTASYGLQFNRAALLLREKGRGSFVGRMAIGHLEERQARSDWEQDADRQDGVNDFAHYLQLLDRDATPTTPLEKGIRKVRFDLNAYPDSAFAEAVQQRLPLLVEPGDTAVIPDEFAKAFEPAAPLVIVPIEAHKQVIGLLVADNKFTRAPVSAADLKLLATFANTAAIAYDNARRVSELEQLNRSARAMAEPFGSADERARAVDRVLDTIVEQARRVLSSDSATIWSYDLGEGKFIPEELRTSGLSQEALKIFRDLEPWRQGTTYKVLEEGWVGVADVADPEYDFIRGQMRDHLRASGVRAFQGISLRVGNEPVGVLYSGFSQPRPFGPEDRRELENFATYAALSLKNARLLDQVIAAKKAAQVVAEVTALGDYEQTLTSIAEGTLAAVGCHAIVLYAYDPATQRWKYPPTHAGVNHPEDAWPNEYIPKNSIVNLILNRNEPLIAERVSEHKLLRERRFSREEGIESCVALPLVASGLRLGVMFVNYRSRNRFRRDELSSIKLFANQAAVAIRNAQLFERQARLLKKQHSLLDMSEELLLLNDEQKILDRAVDIAARTLEADYCNIVLPDRAGRLLFRAGYGWERALINNYELAPDKGSQTGYTIAHGRPVVVRDYNDRAERDFDVPNIVSERGLRSGLSVPMFSGRQVIGSMLVHTRSPRVFDEEDVNLLRLIANQTAGALGGAQQFQAVQRQSAYLNALYEGSKKLSAAFGDTPKAVLQRILELAIEGLTSDGKKPFLGTIQLYDEETKELVLESVYPPESHPELVKRIKERRSLDPKLSGGRVGITGLAVLKGKAFVIDDVSKYADEYIEYDSRTISELVVPLRSGNKVIGVINVESDRPAAFDKGDRKALTAFSELAVIAIKNAEQYAELKQTKGLVGARTALAWMGMMSSLWRHDIDRQAQDILNQVKNTRDNRAFKAGVPDWLAEKLDHIEKQATKIRDAPTVPLLSQAAGELIELGEFVAQRLNLLWDGQHRYDKARLAGWPDADSEYFVRVSREWLRTAFDILVDNAFDAVEALPEERRWIGVETRPAEGGVELIVSDGGEGIPDDIRDQIFHKPVERTQADGQPKKGLGMGLLMAQVIVEAYAGRLRIGATSPAGTSMVIWLPTQDGS